jgi:hemerythrin-like domain-containing protein
MEPKIDTSNKNHTAPAKLASCGCVQHHFEKPTEVLSDEHRVIERVLGVLDKLTQRPVEPQLAHWKKALDFIRHFADQCHHLKEEKLLFPAMEEHGIPPDGGPVGVMLMEHEEGRGYVRSMLAAIDLVEAKNQGAEESLLASARAYLRLLKEHIEKEDEILFKIADDVIPVDEQKRLLQHFEEHEALEMGSGVHERYLAIAEELEKVIA